MNRKGISPIIASVLLLAVSLAVVGIFSGWAPELAQGVTDETENTTYETIACNEASVEIRSAYDDGTDITVSVRNNGDEDLNNLSLVAFNQNGQILAQKNDVALSTGQISDKNISGSSGADYVEAFSEQCGSVTDRLDDINS